MFRSMHAAFGETRCAALSDFPLLTPFPSRTTQVPARDARSERFRRMPTTNRQPRPPESEVRHGAPPKQGAFLDVKEEFGEAVEQIVDLAADASIKEDRALDANVRLGSLLLIYHERLRALDQWKAFVAATQLSRSRIYTAMRLAKRYAGPDGRVDDERVRQAIRTFNALQKDTRTCIPETSRSSRNAEVAAGFRQPRPTADRRSRSVYDGVPGFSSPSGRQASPPLITHAVGTEPDRAPTGFSEDLDDAVERDVEGQSFFPFEAIEKFRAELDAAVERLQHGSIDPSKFRELVDRWTSDIQSLGA